MKPDALITIAGSKLIDLNSETKGREKVTLVVDFKSFSQLTGMSQIKISQEFMKILSDHMPGKYSAIKNYQTALF